MALLGAAAGIWLWTRVFSGPGAMPIFIDGRNPEIHAKVFCSAPGPAVGTCALSDHGVKDFVGQLSSAVRGAPDCNGLPVFVIWSGQKDWPAQMSDAERKALFGAHFDLMVDFYPGQEAHDWTLTRSDKPIGKWTVIPWARGTIRDIANAVCTMADQQRG